MENNIMITDSIFAVVVPEDATKIKDTFANGVYYKLSNGAYDSIYFDDFHIAMNYKIIGTATLPDLQFDFEVDESWVERLAPEYSICFYGNHLLNNYSCKTKKESLRTRIQKSIQDAGLLLVNPHGEKPKFLENDSVNFKNVKGIRDYNESESKVLKGKLLLIEKIK